jgi:hypothetical protein
MQDIYLAALADQQDLVDLVGLAGQEDMEDISLAVLVDLATLVVLVVQEGLGDLVFYPFCYFTLLIYFVLIPLTNYSWKCQLVQITIFKIFAFVCIVVHAFSVFVHTLILQLSLSKTEVNHEQ